MCCVRFTPALFLCGAKFAVEHEETPMNWINLATALTEAQRGHEALQTLTRVRPTCPFGRQHVCETSRPADRQTDGQTGRQAGANRQTQTDTDSLVESVCSIFPEVVKKKDSNRHLRRGSNGFVKLSKVSFQYLQSLCRKMDSNRRG